MKFLMLCLLVLSLFGCRKGIRVSATPEPIIPMLVDSIQYEKDKKQIEKCLESNLEFQRTSVNSTTKWGYSENTPLNSIESKVLGIYYSPDLLRAVIFTSLATDNYYENEPNKLTYSVTVKIGLRKNIYEGFTIYPNRMAGQGGDDESLAFKRIKLYWFYTLDEKNKELNLGGKDFWEKNNLFKRVKLTDTGEEVYKFQTYQVRTGGNDKYEDNHFLHNVLDCSGEIDLNKNNGSKGIDFEFIQEERERKDR